MCQEHCHHGCEHAENPVREPEECSPEQVKECHGDEEGHHCGHHG
ncbi:MAG: hypothetical protein V3R87_10795 [Dehalococcoidia bacterium]